MTKNTKNYLDEISRTEKENFLKEKADEANFILKELEVKTTEQQTQEIQKNTEKIIRDALVFKNIPKQNPSETLGYEIATEYLSNEKQDLYELYQKKYKDTPNPVETQHEWIQKNENKNKLPSEEKRSISKN